MQTIMLLQMPIEELWLVIFAVISIYAGYVESAGGCNLQCPGLGDPADHTVCCTNNGISRCCSYKTLAGIMGGVFGSLLLIGIIIGVVCCVKVKKGDWVCVQVGPSKYTMMSKAKANYYKEQRERARQDQIQMRQQIENLQRTQETQQQQIAEQNRYIQELQDLPGKSPPPPYDASTATNQKF